MDYLADKSWMFKYTNKFSRCDQSFVDGVHFFVEYAKKNKGITGKGVMLCPCAKCENKFNQDTEMIAFHIVKEGFFRGYTTWHFHGESRKRPREENQGDAGHGRQMESMLNDAFLQETGETSTRQCRTSPAVCSNNETQEQPIVETSKARRGRGPTMGKTLIPPPGQKWLCMVANNLVEDGEGGALSHQLGIYSRTWSYFPLNIQWECQAPGVFDEILKDLKKHYVFRYLEGNALVPDEVVKTICKKSLCQMVKKWRNKLKKKYDEMDQESRKICPDPRLTQAEWESIVKYWAKSDVIESSKRNKANRAHAQAFHTLGSKSIARHYMEERKRLGDDFTILGSYLSAHRRKDGSYLNKYTQEKCVEVERVFHEKNLQQSQETTDLPPILDQVFGRHHGGFERGMGGGWSRRSHQYSSTSATRIEVLSTQVSVVQDEKKAMMETIENFKETHKEEIRALEARMEEKLQAQLQAQAKMFMDIMKTRLSAFDSSSSQDPPDT
ncbi:hypothetical protein H6P81_016624 [Aristolochia fimbriata]|uniref:Transposase-associated domain-containing protein n=1 Tax=Aristolochia fimbriata TaxID=158543 RepID=A0AAV7EAH8_ARIFI|nr:hypothetical protein H6P81_016624 [Aristolochia fimbriata]